MTGDSRPVRVCLDLTPLEIRDRHGGIGRYALQLAAELLALHAESGAGLEFFGALSTREAPLPLALALERSPSLGPEISSGPHRRRRRLQFGRRLRGAGIDLFHSLDPATLPWWPGCPIVSTSYDVIPLVLPGPPGPLGRGFGVALKRAGLRRSYQRAAHVIAISELTRRDLIRELGLPPERISVVHLGVDSRRFSSTAPAGERDQLRRRHGLPEQWFLCVSSDHHRKNHARLFEAWVALAERVPQGLVFVGKALYEQTLQQLTARAEQRGLGRQLRWLSDIDDAELPALYRHATAAVAPSLYEGFGMTILEAMASGAPVAAAANGAYEEVGGDAALYFDPREVSDITRTLLRLATDSALRADLGARGLARASNWSWRKTALGTLGAYRLTLGLDDPLRRP